MQCIVVLAVLVCSASLSVAAEGEAVFPTREWEKSTPADAEMDSRDLERAREYALTGGGSGYVTRHGKLVLSWGDVRQRYDLKSTTKSIGVTALGLAIADGKMRLTDLASKHHPSLGVPPEENRKAGWLDRITLFHLATQTAGFEKPGGYAKLLFEPGTKWHYSDAGPNWLAECVTLAYRRDVDQLMFERVFTPIGITREDLKWRKNQYRPHEIDGIARREFGAGVHANVDAMARLGYLYLRGGKWQGKQLIPREFVELAGKTPKEISKLPSHGETEHGNAASHYGLLWWNNNDGTLANVPRDAYWSWGLYDSLIVVIPSLDVVVSRAGKSWKREVGGKHYDVLRPFLEPIVASAGTLKRSEGVIRGIEWAPVETIVKKARGSDNWPMTWGEDNAQYTAYGDGWGFEPRVPKKLSLGFARVTGSPADFAGENIRSESGETVGDDRRGRKASGMLMVDGVLYMLARNAGNSTLAWSTDGARTWAWADWKFETSFGCPTFLNFGRNYRGARDEYVYLYSQDRDDAYTVVDRVVMGRVRKDRIKVRGAYEFFAGFDTKGAPKWSRDVGERAAVVEQEQGCYRCGVTYNAGIGRYLMAMTLPDGETTPKRYYLNVYEAPEPWGPWVRVRFENGFDVDTGESASFPTKWMSEDGLTLHLVFSGEDSFSVRRATLKR